MSNTELCERFEREAKSALEHQEQELGKIRTGRAHASLVEELPVEQYGTTMPLNQIASIAIPEPRTITIQPWDKNALKHIEKAILESHIGLTPNNNGERILLTMPPMTEETRKEYAKLAKQKTEESKITIRNIREQIIRDYKKEHAEGSKEDEHGFKEELQKFIDVKNTEIESLLAEKEKEIMEI